jgi:DNA-directed RNA polymerase subunit RPC12/RpoP
MAIRLETSIYLLIGRATSFLVQCYPQPDSVPVYTVCASCKAEVSSMPITDDSGVRCSYHCRQCGEVATIRSAVKNSVRAIEESKTKCSYCGHPESVHSIGCHRPQYESAELFEFPLASRLTY